VGPPLGECQALKHKQKLKEESKSTNLQKLRSALKTMLRVGPLWTKKARKGLLLGKLIYIYLYRKDASAHGEVGNFLSMLSSISSYVKKKKRWGWTGYL
jgi:hypothetical protein